MILGKTEPKEMKSLSAKPKPRRKKAVKDSETSAATAMTSRKGTRTRKGKSRKDGEDDGVDHDNRRQEPTKGKSGDEYEDEMDGEEDEARDR
ncbi:hypothetical protein D9758_009990 [Tetrapyrgos nigripes]|uniref:Uncharacterized protein n=1 Tax=Tetrapyrgos nigripes TaxID=182062 RepID=A0A8H5FT23_9AGAR|nr:hypothetical protein D9758_009990 [Tetrapyrgos nigripes]